jgi:uncharacterized protein (DUF433 family)
LVNAAPDGNDPDDRFCGRTRRGLWLRSVELMPVIVRHDRQTLQTMMNLADQPRLAGKWCFVYCGPARCNCGASSMMDEIITRPRTEAAQRARVVAEARTWIGTPYHHAADVKRHGVDCAMILIRVYCDLGIVESFDPRPYTRDWFMHRGEEKYLGHLFGRSKEVRQPGLGDIVVFQMGRCYGHAGIVSRLEPFSIIHAFAPAGRAVEDIVETFPELIDRMKKAEFASFWGGADGLPSS